MSRIVPPWLRNRSNAAARVLISALFLSACAQSAPVTNQPSIPDSDPVVAVIDGRPIPMSEFEKQYLRSSGFGYEPVTDTLAAYQDFLERYVDFRLKVLEAREAGYHELDDLKKEIQGYRNQLARPYLLDQEVTEPLIEEMYARRMEIVEASHILLRLGPNAAPADTMAVYMRMASLADSLQLGADFGILAYKYSEDPSASRPEGSPGHGGYLSSFGGGKMVKPFEDAAYETNPGEVSPIFRTQFGYHILKVHSRRPMPVGISIAHILIQMRGNTAADSANALARMHEVQDRLASGEDFGIVAKDLSDDRASAPQGGLFQDLAYDAGLPDVIIETAYSLDEGELSDVVDSPFGSHLIKLIAYIPHPSYEDAHDEIKAQVSRLPRAKEAEKQFAMATRRALGQSADSTLIKTWAETMAPDSLFRALSGDGFDDVTQTSPIATLGDSTYTVRRFTSFLSTVASPPTRDPLSFIWASLDLFLNDAAIQYRIEELEAVDPGYSQTMHQFREGLILFRLMEDSVWTAASVDSTGLEIFYNEHAESYLYGDRTRVISITSNSDSLLQMLVDAVRAGKTLDDGIVEALLDSTYTVRVDTTMIEGATDSIFDQILEREPGEITDPVSYNRGFIALYHDGIDPARQQTFEEARSRAVNGYQEILEKKLLERLRDKYGVRVYPDRLHMAFTRRTTSVSTSEFG